MDDLADRIRSAAARIGGLNKLADKLSVSRRALGRWIDGSSEPKASNVLQVSEVTGVSVSWLITGEGPMLGEPSTQSQTTYERSMIERLADLADRVHKDFNINLSRGKLAAEAADLHNQLVVRVADINDPDEVEATLPQLEYALKKRLREAAAEPGTGKREVS